MKKKNDNKKITGFSQLSKRGKIKWIVENFFTNPEGVMNVLMSFWHHNEEQQKILDGFSENTISNYCLPYGVAPNFVIDGKTYCIPMVTEESSVVAAASSAAKYWMNKGGIKTRIKSKKKVGQIHFRWKGDWKKLSALSGPIKEKLRDSVKHISTNMESRGGGILDIEFIDKTQSIDDYYQVFVTFDTCDSMGANFINSVLETMAQKLQSEFTKISEFSEEEKSVEVIMSILSNYTPECLVCASVECDITDLDDCTGQMTGAEFAEKFCLAIQIAKIDPYRAATHNKGIMNGIDAVILATANDFRAVEACAHSFAARDGQYRSLSDCSVENNRFKFWIDIPLAVGTIGGLTSLHPIAKTSLELLENPSAEDLMKIIASAGLVQNFAAIRSLITTGIQKGHMKMHLMNILLQLEATEKEKELAKKYFSNQSISYSAVVAYLYKIRSEEKANISI